MKCKVKWFSNEKGYGFIEYKDKDIFVHYSQIIDQKSHKKNLVSGEYVTLQVVKTDKGLKAKNVESI